MKDFRRLKVWEKSHAVVLMVYRLSRGFPREELFGLTSQARRSAASIPSNIAEGCGRDTNADFARFLQIAMGSAMELEYQMMLARDLNYIGPEDYVMIDDSIHETKRMLYALIDRVRRPVDPA